MEIMDRMKYSIDPNQVAAFYLGDPCLESYFWDSGLCETLDTLRSKNSSQFATTGIPGLKAC